MMQNRGDRTKIVGLTGGTGSGKSTIARIVQSCGVKVIDADIVAREIVRPGKKVLEEIIQFFGSDILFENGELNRKKLGTIVFADKEKLKKLNSIMYQHIIDEITREIEILKQENAYNIIMIDAAVLIESNLHLLCDSIWVVTAKKEKRLERIMKRDGLSKEDAWNRINSQLSEDEMIRYATHVIDNSRGLEEVERKVRNALYMIG